MFVLERSVTTGSRARAERNGKPKGTSTQGVPEGKIQHSLSDKAAKVFIVASRVDGGPKPILIADDNSLEAEALKRIIVEIGIANPIEIVLSADAVIDRLSGSPPFADQNQYVYPVFLFLDLAMPEKSGIEVLRWLRKQVEPKHSFLGIVVITDVRNVGVVPEAYQLGAHSFLLKPVLKSDLSNLVNNLRGIRFILGKAGRQLDFILH